MSADSRQRKSGVRLSPNMRALSVCSTSISLNRRLINRKLPTVCAGAISRRGYGCRARGTGQRRSRPAVLHNICCVKDENYLCFDSGRIGSEHDERSLVWAKSGALRQTRQIWRAILPGLRRRYAGGWRAHYALSLGSPFDRVAGSCTGRRGRSMDIFQAVLRRGLDRGACCGGARPVCFTLALPCMAPVGASRRI